MIESGIAKPLSPDQYYYVDYNGEKVEKELESVGALVKVEVTYPGWIFFGDEVDTDISQKNDGHNTVQKFVFAEGT